MSRYSRGVPKSLLDCCTPLVRATLAEGQAVELEQVFKALADRNRVKILNLLASADGAVCVCTLIPALGLAQPTVSYHLRLLVEAGLLERERRGRFAYYRIVDGALERVGDLVRGRDGAEAAAA